MKTSNSALHQKPETLLAKNRGIRSHTLLISFASLSCRKVEGDEESRKAFTPRARFLAALPRKSPLPGHSRESGNPLTKTTWTPASAGVTGRKVFITMGGLQAHVGLAMTRFGSIFQPPLRRIPTFIALACASVMLVVSTACNRQAATAVTASGQTASSSDTASLFTVEQDKMAHIQVVPVAVTNLPQVLTLPGSVTYNSFETTPVITQVSGPVLRVLVYPGQFVKKGQPMLTVTSPDYAVMRDSYIKAHDSFNLAEINVRRAKDLYSHEAISLSALEQAQSADVQAKADLTAAEQALRVIGISNPAQVVGEAASPEIPLLAPLNGEVVERTVSPGQVIAGGSTQCFTISNMSTVWVLANVYQSALQYIHLGDHVLIETNAYPMKFSGRISYIAPAMDPTTRTLQVRIVTNNPGQRLKKDMYVTVVVNAGVIHNALTVPAAAVLRNSENQPFVYVARGSRQFARRLVEIGATEGGQTQITSGLEPGEQVMGDGSLFVEFANSLR